MARNQLIAPAFASMLLLLMLAATAAAQPAYSLEGPDCEADPFQQGCDPACADAGKICAHPLCPTGLAGDAPQAGASSCRGR